jgi:hypothetical protein
MVLKRENSLAIAKEKNSLAGFLKCESSLAIEQNCIESFSFFCHSRVDGNPVFFIQHSIFNIISCSGHCSPNKLRLKNIC